MDGFYIEESNRNGRLKGLQPQSSHKIDDT